CQTDHEATPVSLNSLLPIVTARRQKSTVFLANSLDPFPVRCQTTASQRVRGPNEPRPSGSAAAALPDGRGLATTSPLVRHPKTILSRPPLGEIIKSVMPNAHLKALFCIWRGDGRGKLWFRF